MTVDLLKLHCRNDNTVMTFSNFRNKLNYSVINLYYLLKKMFFSSIILRKTKNGGRKTCSMLPPMKETGVKDVV